MSLCQHGNEAVTCDRICGTFRECAHQCCEHEPYTYGILYDIRRACLKENCDCGKYSDLATEDEARKFGENVGAALADHFLAHPEDQGPKFEWGKDSHVRATSVLQWHLAARYGFEPVVEEAAVEVWRSKGRKAV